MRVVTNFGAVMERFSAFVDIDTSATSAKTKAIQTSAAPNARRRRNTRVLSSLTREVAWPRYAVMLLGIQ